jgi:hypothetical protein
MHSLTLLRALTRRAHAHWLRRRARCAQLAKRWSKFSAIEWKPDKKSDDFAKLLKAQYAARPKQQNYCVVGATTAIGIKKSPHDGGL